jgi:hypothetical protein
MRCGCQMRAGGGKLTPDATLTRNGHFAYSGYAREVKANDVPSVRARVAGISEKAGQDVLVPPLQEHRPESETQDQAHPCVV